MNKKMALCGRFGKVFFFFYNPLASIIRFFSKEEKRVISENPKILLCCWASLGDVLLATSIIEPIRKKWPRSTIGFLCSPASLSVIKDAKEIDKIHQVPSWMVLGQGKIKNLFSLAYYSLYGYRNAIKELKEAKYDISIELHPFFPNCLPLARRGKIPCRVGFASGGYDVWMTHPVNFPEKWGYLPTLYPRLLEQIEVKEVLKPVLSTTQNKSRRVVLHMGTSDPRKLWETSHWSFVGKALKEKGYEIVLTGKGKEDNSLITQSGLASIAENLCDKLDYAGLSQVLQEAALVISIDSLPVHLAALQTISFIGLYLYNANVELWLPEASNCYLFIHSRCIRRLKEITHPRGIYLDEITPSIVLSKALDLLGESP